MMELRPLLVLGAVLALVLGNVYLISQETITKSKEQTTDQLKRIDVLRDIVYSESSRAENFALFGLDDAGVKTALKRAALTEEDYGSKLRQLLADAGEPLALADALCGSTDQVRPRYGALGFLVEGKGERRGPIDLRQASTLERQDWSVASPIQSVFETAELSDGRQKDATVMALAAIFEGKEDLLIQRERPWGRPTTNKWSYSTVKSDHPGVEDRVIWYLAIMHVTVEIAQSSDGICGE